MDLMKLYGCKVFGVDAAMVMVPLVAMERGDPLFVALIRKSMQEADTTSSFVENVRRLWPQSAIAELGECLEASAYAQYYRQQQQMLQQMQIVQQQQHDTAQEALYSAVAPPPPPVPPPPSPPPQRGPTVMTAETLERCGVLSADELYQAQEALALLQNINKKIQERSEHPANQQQQAPLPQQQPQRQEPLFQQQQKQQQQGQGQTKKRPEVPSCYDDADSLAAEIALDSLRPMW